MFIRMKNDIGIESKEINFVWSQVVEGSLKPQMRHQVGQVFEGGSCWGAGPESGGSWVGNSCRLRRVQVTQCLLGWSTEVVTG